MYYVIYSLFHLSLGRHILPRPDLPNRWQPLQRGLSACKPQKQKINCQGSTDLLVATADEM